MVKLVLRLFHLTSTRKETKPRFDIVSGRVEVDRRILWSEKTVHTASVDQRDRACISPTQYDRANMAAAVGILPVQASLGLHKSTVRHALMSHSSIRQPCNPSAINPGDHNNPSSPLTQASYTRNSKPSAHVWTTTTTTTLSVNATPQNVFHTSHAMQPSK